MGSRSSVFAVWLALFSCWSHELHAQAADVETPRELYDRGARAYAAGEFEAAITAFQRAHAISGKPALLFNIAQAERLLGPSHCQRALSAYQRYLNEEPKPENLLEVEQRIGEMQACSDASERDARRSQTQPQKPALPVASTSPAAPRSPIGPWLTLGTGAVLAGSGAVIYALARSKFDAVASSCPCREGEFAGWERASNVSYGLLALGGAAMAVGAGWWFFEAQKPRTSGYALGLSYGRVSLSGSF